MLRRLGIPTMADADAARGRSPTRRLAARIASSSWGENGRSGSGRHSPPLTRHPVRARREGWPNIARDFELDGPPRLLLNDDCASTDLWPNDHIANPDFDQVAATKLAVNCSSASTKRSAAGPMSCASSLTRQAVCAWSAPRCRNPRELARSQPLHQHGRSQGHKKNMLRAAA